MFAKKADYTGRWHIYTAPFTLYLHNGKMLAFATGKSARAFIASL